jgi:hypothetical protein
VTARQAHVSAFNLRCEPERWPKIGFADIEDDQKATG